MQKINGHNIADNLYEPAMELIGRAYADKCNLTVGGGTRTYNEQLTLRRAHVIDKSKQSDMDYLAKADNGLFNPRTARPGTSNHELKDGKAYAIDFNTKGPNGTILKEYEWLVKNAHKYGWVRTVPSERWHWEYRPGWGRYQYVPKDHESWDGHNL